MTIPSLVSCSFKLTVERDEDAARAEIHFVLIKYLQVMVIFDNSNNDPG
jgi:hypothetical protein